MLAAVSLAFAALSAVTAAPVPVVESSVALPNTTQTEQVAFWFTQDGRAGACGSYSSDADVVVGLPLEFYPKYDAVSPYCGSFVVVKGDNNKTVTALVADASTLNNTITLSVAAWRSLDGDDGLSASPPPRPPRSPPLPSSADAHLLAATVDWRFANETEAAAAAQALKDSPATSVVETPAAATSAKAPSWTSSHAAATPSSSSSSTWAEHTAAATTSPAAEKKESSSASSSAAWTSSSAWHSSAASSSSAWSSEYAAPSSSSSAAAEKKVAASSSSTWAPEPSSSSASTKEWKESSTSSYEAPKTTTTAKRASLFPRLEIRPS